MDVRFGQLEKRVDERFDDVDRRFKETDRRIDEGFREVKEDLKGVKGDFKGVDERLARMESRIDHVSEVFVDLGKSIDFSTRALIVTMVIGFLTIVVTKL